MPQTKAAKKALARSRKRRIYNLRVLERYRQARKAFVRQPTLECLSQLYSAIDRCVKRHIFHKNKGARLKRRFAQKVKEKKATGKK